MTPGVPRCLAGWVALVSRLVPTSRRARWHEEWVSELWYGFAEPPTRPTRRRRLSLVIGALVDALTVRRDSATPLKPRAIGDGLMTQILRDFRYSLRTLRRAPGFSAVVVITLALGIGANTAVFNVMYGTLLKPLPYSEPDRLVRLYVSYEGVAYDGALHGEYMPGPDFLDYRNGVASFENLAALYDYRETGFNLSSNGSAIRVRALRISADYFSVYRTAPILGRVFTREEETADARFVILSHHLWQQHSGGSRDVIGQTLNLGGELHEIVGVMPEGFYDLVGGNVDMWIPQNLAVDGYNSRGNHYLTVVGRLREDATLARARQEAEVVAAGIRERFPDAAEGRRTLVVPLSDDVAGNTPTLLYLLLGASALVLLIASVNVANLYLTRTASRARELAVRSALGSSRARLAGQLLADGVVLAMIGGAVGTAVAYFGSSTMLTMAGDSLARSHEITFGAPVLAFTFGVTLLTGLGLFPAWHMSRPQVGDILRESGRGASGSRGQQRFRDSLVVAQIALALTLLVGAGLLIKSFARLQDVDLGFRTARVLTFEFSPGSADYNPAARVTLYQRFHDKVRNLPGATGAGAVSRIPATGRYHIWGYRQPANPDRGWVSTQMRVVEGDYFEIMEIPLLRGRLLRETDRADTAPVILLNQRAAEQGFGEDDPIGQTVHMGGRDWTVAGIAANTPDDSEGNLTAKAYVRHAQYGDNRNWPLTQVVSFAGGGVELVDDIRRELRALDAGLVIHGVRPIETILQDGVARQRLAMALLTTFAAVAIVLAGVGVYGVLAYGVQLRTREIGIRIALGATAGSVRSLITGRGLGLSVAGIALGTGLAFGLTRFLDSLLFNISTHDPVTFGLVPVGILLVSAASAFIPAVRATRVDPVDAIRTE